MSYIVRSSEKLRKPAADAETKALLYLMSFYKNSNEIYYFVIDFFNDLTGLNRTANKLWDLQSKGAKNSSPKSIGKELVTLFKNFLSEIDFEAYILFLGGVTSSFRVDNQKNIFGIENVKNDAIKKMKEGLIEECILKNYIDFDQTTDELITMFFSKVTFVIDDKTPIEYVKNIIKNHPKLMPEDEVLKSIFEEIRDKQSLKKNANVVEDIVIQTTEEALDYCRHLTSNEIRLLTMQRIMNHNILEKGIPLPFLEIISKMPEGEKKKIINECQMSCCRALFNSNRTEEYWSFFENAYSLIVEFPDDNVSDIYKKIDKGILESCPDLDVHSFKYFISIMKEGLEK